MKYTVEQVGNRWVASNGADHVEAEEPDEALFRLLIGESDREEGMDFDQGVRDTAAGECRERIGRCAVNLISLLAINAPASILRNTAKSITDYTERFIGLSDVEE